MHSPLACGGDKGGLDIAADRIIENVFWIYFAVNDIIHFWMPLAILTRGFITDAIEVSHSEMETHLLR